MLDQRCYGRGSEKTSWERKLGRGDFAEEVLEWCSGTALGKNSEIRVWEGNKEKHAK